ncbi:MAG: gfo/Idh/MocA family oxidoreductase, partial [Oscillospiraceae bacterium]|nr:gfo/Idh/MocA family oxidoreductase [Oscillospiraceae bacterium]
MKTLRVGIIGTGFIGEQHVEAVRRIPGTEVAAIVDRNEDITKAASERLAVPKYYTDYRELLKDESIDVIHNCTPSSMHYAINIDAMKSGKHIYCEKPLTLDTKESSSLVEFAERYGVANGVNFNYRHNAMVQEMRERLRNQSVGKPLIIHGQYLQDWMMYDTDYNWRMDPKIGGQSRAVADIGSHCFDTSQYILGKKIVAVYAQLITVFPIRKRYEDAGDFSDDIGKVLKEINISSEDAAFIMVKYEDNTPGLFNISQICGGKKNGLEIVLSASKASLEWQQESPDKLFIGNRDVPNEILYVDRKYLTGGAKEYA